MQPLSPEQWQSLSENLDRILDAGEEERAERLAALRGIDPDMASRVEALLATGEQQGFSEFLQVSQSAVVPELAGATWVGREVGPYVIDAEVGRGGMGSVWRAHRADGRFASEVAIKFVHAAWIGRSGEQRFRLEGTLLGQLNHANIARLLDAGVVEGTQPYLVLEYVRGQPIDDYCAARQLNVEQRVRLFLDVLAAVAHAHSHLIVHRDIKPANIFVTDDGVVKLLDFGIAKLLDDGASALTQSHGGALTPQYAAPEQLTGQSITTATDVYALGLVLYLLLTGKHPFPVDTHSSAALIHAVLTQDPPRASTATTVPMIKPRALQGDLDNIVLKALKKSPSERYPSAEAFAADLRGYLHHEPISARRDSFTYVIGKLVRRHRLQVGAASMTLLALIAGVVGTALQAREARHQRTEALAQRDRARVLLVRHDAIVDFVEMMLTESVPQDQIPAMQQMLDRGIKFADVSAAGQPDRQAEMLRVLASYYVDLDNAQKASSLLERARRLVRGNGDTTLQAELACTYGTTLNMLGRTDEALALYEHWSSNPAIDGNVAGFCLQSRAIVAQNQGNATDALTYTDRALARVEGASIPSARLRADLTGDRGFALHLAGRNGEADAYFESALQQYRKIGLEESRTAKIAMANWGVVAYGSGNFKRGLEIFQQLLRGQEALAGSEPISPGVLGNYAHGLEAMGRYPEALSAYDRTLDSAEKTGFLGGKGYALAGKASVLIQMGDLAQAQVNVDLATALIQGKVPDASPIQLRRVFAQAQIDGAQGRRAQAIAELSGMLDLLSAGGAPPNAAAVAAYRARAELELKDSTSDGAPATAHAHAHALTDALADAQKAVHAAENLQSGNRYSSDTGLAYLTLGTVLLESGDRPAARAALLTAIDQLNNALGTNHPDTQRAQHLLATL